MIHAWFGRPFVVSAAYLAITVVLTWPVAAGLARDIPGDLGDPAFVTGMIAWGAEHWLALFTGDWRAAATFWSAPIFAPEPLTTAYSEHFALHSLLTLPAYALTRNPVLCYNLSFFATFVLSGLGMYLLIRELTGRSGAAFVAGLAFAFAPYRAGATAHLQVLSAQWMPFVLYGLRRYMTTRNSDALVVSAAALWAQNLSSGYYMLFFGPFVALYAVLEIWTRRLLRDWVVWRNLVVTAVVALVATLPFALPYLTRRINAGRPLFEVIWYSADLMGWLTASPWMLVWGKLQTFVKAEGFLFPGVTVVILSCIGIWTGLRSGRSATSDAPDLRGAAIFGGLAVLLSFWLSLGPQIQIETQPVDFPSLYRLLSDYVPGFSASRVPARFAMVTVFALALLAGLGLRLFDVAGRRWVLAVCGVLLVAEGSAFPLPVNGTWTSAPEEFYMPEARLYRLADAPPVYRYLQGLDSRAVILHLPFGVPEREIQYGYYASLHGRRIANGYSGAFPPSYNARMSVLRFPLGDADTLKMTLETDRVSHIVVHTAAWVGDRGLRVLARFEQLGWRREAVFDSDFVLVR